MKTEHSVLVQRYSEQVPRLNGSLKVIKFCTAPKYILSLIKKSNFMVDIAQLLQPQNSYACTIHI